MSRRRGSDSRFTEFHDQIKGIRPGAWRLSRSGSRLCCPDPGKPGRALTQKLQLPLHDRFTKGRGQSGQTARRTNHHKLEVAREQREERFDTAPFVACPVWLMRFFFRRVRDVYVADVLFSLWDDEVERCIIWYPGPFAYLLILCISQWAQCQLFHMWEGK